jgi:hypothetical protein
MFDIKLTGDLYNETCEIKYSDKLIYKGYVDELVTSENGNLEVHLNYGESDIIKFKIKRVGDIILWIPVKISNMHTIDIYDNIIVNIREMEKLWEKLRYDFRDDEPLIDICTAIDLKLLWLINSKLHFQEFNTLEVISQVKNSIIFFEFNRIEKSNGDFYNLICNDWDITNIKLFNSVKQINENSVYLLENNNSIEWCPFLKNNKDNEVLNLGGGWGLKLDKICNDI